LADISMKNYMEYCVAEILPEVLQTLDTCQCDRCKMDITAYALNHLPPKYVVTKTGHLYTKLAAMRTQFDVDIVTTITKGSQLIADQPRHDQ